MYLKLQIWRHFWIFLGIYVKFFGGNGLYVKNTSSQVHAVDQQGARTPEQFGIFLEQPSSLSPTAIIGFAKKRRGVIGST